MAARSTGARLPGRVLDALLVVALAVFPLVARSADSGSSGASPAIDAEAFFAAIVKIETRALPDARSAATLGTEREGSGIVETVRPKRK